MSGKEWAFITRGLFSLWQWESLVNKPFRMMRSLHFRCLSLVASNGHNQKVHMHMVDLMSSIICEGDTVSQELLDTVLVNLVPAHKVQDCSDVRVRV